MCPEWIESGPAQLCCVLTVNRTWPSAALPRRTVSPGTVSPVRASNNAEVAMMDTAMDLERSNYFERTQVPPAMHRPCVESEASDLRSKQALSLPASRWLLICRGCLAAVPQPPSPPHSCAAIKQKWSRMPKGERLLTTRLGRSLRSLQQISTNHVDCSGSRR